MSVHFSGIAGKGMAPAAGLALTGGHQVSGDDIISNHRIAHLREAGAQVIVGRNVGPPPGSTLHVRSSLIDVLPSEVPEQSRLAFVSDVMHASGNSVLAVAGSVGKSTAAGIVWAAHRGGAPACYIGADLPGTLCGGWHSSSTTAIVEADEYKDAYLDIRAHSVILLNVLANHADHFGNGTSGFSRSFADWIQGMGLAPRHVLLGATAAERLAADGFPVGAIVLGTGEDSGADWQMEIISPEPSSTEFRLRKGRRRDTFTIPLAGEHAATAAAFGVLTARQAGLSDSEIRDGLATAELPWRRQSLVHRSPGIWAYDDNARLPDQFIVTVLALRQRHPHAHLVAVISPWGRLNRRDLDAWAFAGSYADTLVVLPVGEAAVSRGGAEIDDADEQLALAVRDRGREALSIQSWADLPEATGETVYVTAGYDAQYDLLSQAHQVLRERHP